MKKFVRVCSWILIAAMLLGGCGAPGGTESVPEPFLDEPTDELNIYVNTYQEDYFKNTLAPRFNEKYPDVTLNIEVIEFTEIPEKINTELMSGGGPDLIFLEQTNDIYKSMKAGVFADLNPILEQDPTFRMSEFYETVMDAGVMNGKRYILPLGFTVPIMMSTEKLLKQYGFNPENCKDFTGFLKEVNTYLDAYASDTNAPSVLPGFPWQCSQLWSYSNMPLGSYETGEITIDEEQLKTILDLSKPLYVSEKGFTPIAGYNIDEEILQDKFLLFYTVQRGNNVANFVSSFRSGGQEPVLFALPTVNGGTEAQVSEGVGIPANSPNKVNAYRFISLLLSSDCQSEYFAIENGHIPVRRESQLFFLTYSQYKGKFYETHEKIGEIAVLNDDLQKFNDYIDGVTNCSLVSYKSTLSIEMLGFFEPYLTDTQSFESCLDEYEQYLMVYLSE